MDHNILLLQQALNSKGFNAGIEDGVRGKQTIAAIKAFQDREDLFVDGIAGDQTLSALFKDKPFKPNQQGMPWINEAKRVMGLHERHNKKRLWDWLKSDGATVGDPTEIPWCGDFVQTAILLSMPDEPVPVNPYLAANWVKFGKPCTPQAGAIMSFWRGSPDSWKGHVAFYMGEDATHFHVLGGNQANTVSIVRIEKKRLRKNGSRWPLTALDAAGKSQYRDGAGLITTTNEA